MSKYLSKNRRTKPVTERNRQNRRAEVQRRDDRLPTFYFAEIYDETGNLLSEATVREISENGIQLRVKSRIDLPDRIQIRSSVDQINTSGTIKWTSGENVGVELDPGSKKPLKRRSKEERVRIVTSHLVGRSVR